MTTVVQAVKNLTRYISLFVIVFNGQQKTETRSTLANLAFYEGMFGGYFWSNACIAVTNFSNSPLEMEKRRWQGISRASVKRGILDVLETHFPNIPSTGLPTYFFDCFDLNKPYDITKQEVRNLVAQTQNVGVPDLYDTSFMSVCGNVQWREYKDQLMTLQLNLFTPARLKCFN